MIELTQWAITSSFVLDSCILYVFYTEMPGTGAYGRDICSQTNIQCPFFTGMHLIDKEYGFCVGSEIYKRGIVHSIREWNSQKIEVFPNPVQNKTTITFKSVDNSSIIYIYDMLGKLVFEKSHLGNSNTEEIDLSMLLKGMYCMIIKADNGIFQKTKLIKL